MRDITLCHPRLQLLAVQLVEESGKQGLMIKIGETLRTVAEQDALYAQGRTKPGSIVTNAPGSSYSSYHQWGTAFDIFRNDGAGPYNDSGNFFTRVGAIGAALGLEWGCLLYTSRLEVLNHSLYKEKNVSGPIHNIQGRLKEKRSIEDKLRRLGFTDSIVNARNELQDIAGIRVICYFVNDIYNMVNILKRQTDLVVIKEKDYIPVSYTHLDLYKRQGPGR